VGVSTRAVLAVAILLLTVAPVLAVPYNPIANLTNATAGGIAGNETVFLPQSFHWNPETGYYTRWWFNTSRTFFDPYGFFYGTLLPIATTFTWGWMFFIMWGAIVTGFYLETQETTMPFVIAVLGGAVMSYLMGSDQIIIMIFVVVFLGAGILTKTLLGRP